VYIAVPPLYKVKLGNQEYYFEKESQLEDLLVRERFDDLEVHDRDGPRVKLTEAKWKRFTGALAEFEAGSRDCAPTSPHAAELVTRPPPRRHDVGFAATPAPLRAARNALTEAVTSASVRDVELGHVAGKAGGRKQKHTRREARKLFSCPVLLR